MQLLLGFILALVIAFLAFKARSLNTSGAIAAACTGTIIFGIGGFSWAVLLLAFFITSSALSRAFKKRKQGLDEKFSKGHERDAGQVLANGGIATLFAALNYFFPHQPWTWVGFAASLAAVNADTWATELGVLNPHPPRMIIDLMKTVEKGTSGGISLVGTLASLTGSAVIALLATLLPPTGTPSTDRWSLFILITLAGLAGSLFDSLLGGTVQAMYFCPTDHKETEKHPLHSCGTPTIHIRGWKWLDNDWVNLSCGAFGAVMALLPFLV
ncbi:MAG TPA: DUF92 domain-containing protein [Anaerolineales bacterium]|nr:DUF92 domain-containing protein [Anaerolineales bacterium]HNO30571.1 DUF92 domain-containing protein [Anaerolineales bacterium]